MKLFLLLGMIGISSLATAQTAPRHNVGIGTSSPSYKLHVVDSGTAIYGNSVNGGYGVYGNSTYLGVYGVGSSYGVYGSGTNYGVYGFGNTYGVYGYGSSYGLYGNSDGNYGVYATSAYVGVYGAGTSYGLSGAGSGTSSYGVSGTGSYIGVFGSSTGGTAVVGNCTNGTGGNFYSTNSYGLVAGTNRTDKNWAAVFNGNTYAYGAYQTSDKKLKKNIKDLGSAMSIINRLKPKSYEFLREGNLTKLDLPLGEHYGLIAQELEEVLPQLVKEVTYIDPVAAVAPDSTMQAGKKAANTSTNATAEKITSKAINYTELIPVIIKAVQEQQVIIDKQSEQIEALKQLVNQLSKNKKIVAQ